MQSGVPVRTDTESVIAIHLLFKHLYEGFWNLSVYPAAGGLKKYPELHLSCRNPGNAVAKPFTGLEMDGHVVPRKKRSSLVRTLLVMLKEG